MALDAKARPTLTVALCLAALLASGFARARGDVVDEARKLFDEALAHVAAGEYEEAATAFSAAYLIKPNWRVLYNIAEAEMGAGNHARALEAYTLYLAEGGEDISRDQQRRVQKNVARLGRLVGLLQVKCPTAGAVVLINGRRQGVTPLLGPALVNAGAHEVVIIKDGRELHRQEIDVDGGQLAWVVVDDSGGRDYAAFGLAPPVEPETGSEYEAEAQDEADAAVAAEPEPAPLAEPEPAPAPIAPDPVEQATGPDIRTWTWVALGTGAAAGLAAVVVGSTALAGARDVEDACDGDRCPAAQLDRAKRVQRLAVTTDVLIGVTAAALVTGGALLLLGRGKKERSDTVTLAPAAHREGGLLIIEGRF